MLSDVVPYLLCPVCRSTGGMTLNGTLRCDRGHVFDPARHGYVQLSAGPIAHEGDDQAMVAARDDFLRAGHYAFIAEAVVAATGAEATATAPTAGARAHAGTGASTGTGASAEARAGAPAGTSAGDGGLVVEVGAGTGYYLAAVLDARPDSVGLALDVSRPALRRAARAHPRAGAVRADAWQPWPLADRRTTAVLNVFAPRNGAEFARVLRPGGVLVVVTPQAGHLAELVEALGLLRVDAEKEARLGAGLTPWFGQTGEERLRRTLLLRHSEVSTVVGMGPSARHLGPVELAGRIAGLRDPCPVTADVLVRRYTLT
jgi:23S rRNA (guanine745-N1)-methyltransferase